jgi:hypothetical protein
MRKAVDTQLTSEGLVLGAILLVSCGMAIWASSIVGDQVKAQLSVLLNDYSFGPMGGRIAGIGAIGVFVGAFLSNQGARPAPVTI